MKTFIQISFFFLLTVQICFAQWAKLKDMPTARWGNAACTLNGKIYVLGGSQSTSSPGYAIAVMEVYDPVLDSWDATKAPMPTARVMFMAGVVEGKIYAIGGRQTWVTGDDLGTVEAYDPLTDTWETKTPMPKPRTNAGVCVHDNKIYIVGGIKGGAAWLFSNDLQIYDPMSNTWDTTKTAMNYARDPYACVLNNNIFSIGGTDGPPYAGLRIVEAYDFPADSWTEKAFTHHGRKGASIDMINGKIYAAGGEDIANPVMSIEVYDPIINKWTILSQTPIWYTMHSSAAFRNKIYLIGGSTTGGRYDIFTPSSIIYSFDPDFAYATSFKISHKYLPPLGDTLIVNAQSVNPNFHPLTVYSYFQDNGFTFQDSVQLFDDGLHHDGDPNDDFYGGVKLLSGLSESFFEVQLKTTDLTKSTIHSYYFNQRFTTAGPLKVDSIFYSVLSSYRYSIKPFIKNEGNTLPISDIQVKLSSSDPWVTQVFPEFRACPTISPGEIKSPSQTFAIYYDSATFPGYFNLKLEISSDGVTYWTDSIVTVVTGIEEKSPIPLAFSLEQNYPNPFNPKTTIKYSIPKLSFVSIKIYDVLGSEVATLVNEEKREGDHTIEFSARGRSAFGGNASELPSGIYFYQLRTGSFVETKKMVLLR